MKAPVYRVGHVKAGDYMVCKRLGQGYRHQCTGWVKLKALVYRVGNIEGGGLHNRFRVIGNSLQGELG